MRADAVDLSIAGSPIRVICEDPGGLDWLREVLSSLIVETPAEPGFVIKRPKRQSEFFLLLDRSGIVLGRDRTIEPCLSMLMSHLAAFVPPPPSTTRVRLRALVSENDHAELAMFPLFTYPAVVERQLERTGYRIVDRMAVDLDDEGRVVLSTPPWPGAADVRPGIGHAPGSEGRLPIKRLLAPAYGSGEPSRARLVTDLAARVNDSSTTRRLEVANTLASVDICFVSPDDQSAMYASLRR